jgi:hypothetical protein
MLAGGGGAMYGQQSLMPLIKAVIWGFGGGQLIEAALVRAAARGRAAAGPAASATAAAASTIVPASLAGGREAGGASLCRCGSLGSIIGFLSLPDFADRCMPCTPGQVSSRGRRRLRPSPRR